MSKGAKSRSSTKATSTKPRVAGKGETAASQTSETVTAAPAAVKPATEAAGKKVSQKLIDTIEKRKQNQQNDPGKKRGYALFSRPGARRGRRPKNAVEYSPSTNEEEAYAVENEYERIEHDTGIRVGNRQDDYGYNLDRHEDFDEELNFDR